MRCASPPESVDEKPVQREIFQADVVQELEALADLDQDLVGDGGFFGRQFERLKELRRPARCSASRLRRWFCRAIRTYSASSRRRAPLQSGHCA